MCPEMKGYAIKMPESNIGKNPVADVVVIGGGGAGVPAALTALEEGAKKVIVLEKRFAPGGDALRANWIFAVESRLQKEAGVTLTRDDIYKQALEFHHYDGINPTVLRTLINKTANSIQWLEAHGIEFELRGMGPDLKMATSHWTKGAPYPNSLCSFGKVYRYLTQSCLDAGVQFLFHTSGKRILRDHNGKVNGVIAADRDKREFQIKTKSVILCPGSFNSNPDLLKKYFPYYYEEGVFVVDTLLPTNTGDGVQMAEEAGAAMADFCTLIRHPMSFNTTASMQNAEGGPFTLRVNKRGQRYLSESAREVSGNVLLKQPGKTVYALYDDNIVQKAVDRKVPPGQLRIPVPKEKSLDSRQWLQKQAKQGIWVKISNSWDEIADWIGCDAKVLKSTIDRYNSFCNKGYDEDFAKEKQFLVPLRTPPYYAVKIQPNIIESIGPVKVNEKMEVVDKQGNPIPGFFAAGVITSGWEGHDYGGTPGGSALGFSIASGRIAAENAAKYVLGK